MTEKNKYLLTVENTKRLFSEAVNDHNFFECVKKIGILEYLNVPDLDFYSGVAYNLVDNYSEAIKHFSMIKPESDFFSLSQKHIVYDYTLLGDYLKLDQILKTGTYDCSPLEELDMRISCLAKADIEYVKKNIDDMRKICARDIPVENYSGENAKLFFNICRTMAFALVVSGECINQCLEYQLSINNEFDSFKENEDLNRYFDEYNKWCLVLEYSKYMKKIVLADGVNSLATYALYDLKWPDKIKVFYGPHYVPQIRQYILTLCRPEMHPDVDRYKAIESILEAYAHIDPTVIAQVVNFYFEDITKAYISGNSTAAQYIGYVYAEILADDQDPLDLKKRIDDIRKADENYDVKGVSDEIKLIHSMSKKGYAALRNAELSYEKTKESIPGANDYSALSLQYFRVVEIEYSEKILIPLAKTLDISKFEKLIDKIEDEEVKKKWSNDYIYLKKISAGDQTSIQLGALRTMLGHVIGKDSQKEECANYLHDIINQLLTEKGKEALTQRKMLNVINRGVLEKYRIPGAHTGFLPYSDALEARKYVISTLFVIATWFK